jgi:hypothetical protein
MNRAGVGGGADAVELGDLRGKQQVVSDYQRKEAEERRIKTEDRRAL